MPELAEVEYFRKQWEPGRGVPICEVQLHADKRIFRNTDPAALETAITGRKFTESRRHGKQLLFGFEKKAWLLIRLGMTGKLHEQPEFYAPDRHDHLVLCQEERKLVFTCSRMFGEARIFTGSQPPDFWLNLPPEILDRDFTELRLKTILEKRSGAVIKALLLDQEIFPGIGNWMADEVLWQARIAPHRRAGDLAPKEIRQLHTKLKAVCRGALQTVGEDWSDPPATWLFQHRWKKGGICPKTGEPLEREDIGGRTTAWSPNWQK